MKTKSLTPFLTIFLLMLSLGGIPFILPGSAAAWVCGNDDMDSRAGHDHWGETWTGAGTGLTLQNTSDNGSGVRGEGYTEGVYGSSRSDYGAGVIGFGHDGVNGFGRSYSGSGIYGYNDKGFGVQGAGNIGVYGSSFHYVPWMGVQGYGTGVWGAGRTGVYGVSPSDNGTGVWGEGHYAVTGWGGDTGVFGDGNRYGVHGQSRITGVLGSSSGNLGVGIRGQNYVGDRGIGVSGTGRRYGVYGYSWRGHAGYFVGDVAITGSLHNPAGGFKIDHPLDPQNQYLYHSFVESPDMKNIYDGVVVLDANGEAWIELAEWFETLNQEFRYQLTPIGKPGPNLYIAQEIQNNRFKIAGGEAGMKISWQVTGIRHDPHAKANPLTVEEEKPVEERGTYLNPEVYDQPKTLGLDYQENQDPGLLEPLVPPVLEPELKPPPEPPLPPVLKPELEAPQPPAPPVESQ